MLSSGLPCSIKGLFLAAENAAQRRMPTPARREEETLSAEYDIGACGSLFLTSHRVQFVSVLNAVQFQTILVPDCLPTLSTNDNVSIHMQS